MSQSLTSPSEAPVAPDGDDLAPLVLRCAGRDAAALHDLYRAQAARLKGLAIRITGDAGLAETVLHDVFLAVWHDSEKFDPRDGSVSAWLTTLTRFRALDARREQPADARAPASDADVTLHGCLQKLDPRARVALSAAFLDGLSHRQIAEREHVPIDTLTSLVRRSLGDLRQCFGS